ncbi:hypothetical protein SynA1825c_01540 [Synechococcus sp. A18-25c]|nr:hypothetical protein SynA1825c_01540 [Synechococcus sp. A18-25c]
MIIGRDLKATHQAQLIALDVLTNLDVDIIEIVFCVRNSRTTIKATQ